MFSELSKYKHTGHFFLKPEDELSKVCNAPSDKSGVYIIYSLKNGKIDLIYIGCSGKKNPDGSMFIRKAGLGGIKDRLVNGKQKQFGNMARKKSWPLQIKKEKIEALDIYWYVTHNETYTDCPHDIEQMLLEKYFEIYGCRPKWNKK